MKNKTKSSIMAKIAKKNNLPVINISLSSVEIWEVVVTEETINMKNKKIVLEIIKNS